MANVFRSRKSGFTQRGGARRRETFWLDLVGTRSVLASGTPVLFTGYSANTLALRPFTIVRTRGILQLASDQEAADETYMAHLGMAIVSDQALAVGVTAVPNPIADADSDMWFLYESMASSMRFGDATGFVDGAGVFRIFDNKAMRKVEDGQDIAVVVENEATPFDGCVLVKKGRQLIKLH